MFKPYIMPISDPLRLAAILLLAAGSGASAANIAIVYSGVLDVPIANTFEGTYVDLDPGTVTDGPSDPDTADQATYAIGSAPVAGWDVNFFLGGIGIAHTETFQPFRDDTGDKLSFVHTVPEGTTIDATSAATGILAVASAGGSGQSIGSSVAENHFGGGSNQFTPGVEAYMAFVLNPDATQLYGWMRVTLENDGSVGTIHDWAYAPDSIDVGAIPEPSGAVLIGCAGVLVMSRRRRPRE